MGEIITEQRLLAPKVEGTRVAQDIVSSSFWWKPPWNQWLVMSLAGL